jgi:DNA-binding PadR family transcriptional regulator
MMMCGTRRFSRHSHFREFGQFGMMGMRSRFFGPGEVRLALLSLIADAPKHGYELMRQLEERSGGIYRASAGTVYPTLQQLEDEGLIASETVEGKRAYRLTQAGRDELDRENETVQLIWGRARRWAGWRSALHPDAAEIRGPAERLVKAAFRAVAGETASEERIDRVREILERAMRDLDAMRGKP